MKKLLAIPMALALFAAVSVGAQTAPTLYVELETNGVATTVNPGATNVPLANIRLDATQSSEDIRIQSLPLTLATATGGRASDLSACRVMNAANTAVSLNNGANVSGALMGGLNTLTFDSPLIIPRGTVTTLMVNCNASAGLVAGSTYQFSINTSNVAAAGAVTGIPAVVAVGRPGTLPSVPPTTTPGIPNTGMGGNATTTVLLLGGAAGIALAGLAYARKFAR